MTALCRFNMPDFAGMTFRQRRLWVEVACDLAVLIAYVATILLAHLKSDPAIAFLSIALGLPIIYNALKLRTAEDTRTDERDMSIENRGIRSGYALMAVGIYILILWFDSEERFAQRSLLILWLLVGLLKNSTQLRIYSGHEGWWPDFIISALRRRQQKHIDQMLLRLRK